MKLCISFLPFPSIAAEVRVDASLDKLVGQSQVDLTVSFPLCLDSSQQWLRALLRSFRFCSCNTSSAMAPGRKQILSTTERIRLSHRQVGTASGYPYVTKVQMIHLRNGVAGRQLLNKPDKIQARRRTASCHQVISEFRNLSRYSKGKRQPWCRPLTPGFVPST